MLRSEQQHKQDLRKIYKGSTILEIITFTRMLCAFYQSALHHEQHNVVTPLCWSTSFSCVDCGWDRSVVMVCFDLPVKRCERDCAWLSQPLLLSSMQNLKVWKSGRLRWFPHNVRAIMAKVKLPEKPRGMLLFWIQLIRTYQDLSSQADPARENWTWSCPYFT